MLACARRQIWQTGAAGENPTAHLLTVDKAKRGAALRLYAFLTGSTVINKLLLSRTLMVNTRHYTSMADKKKSSTETDSLVVTNIYMSFLIKFYSFLSKNTPSPLNLVLWLPVYKHFCARRPLQSSLYAKKPPKNALA